ncbi:hypothetical protein KI688_012182 [Linnemannia hyalina]|uniref:Uncharacterized protein n=1 Tax=Linnemannia hyalina TaxID=64524 RepID=A0A9P7XU36_9FUNG|nr:hypothetical protein KI688_012182 [Linnemannia hyalina]
MTLANSDISYDSSLEYFAKLSNAVFDSHFYAISRWGLATGGRNLEGYKEASANGMTFVPHPWVGSYDAFAFHPRTICADKTKLKDMVESLNCTLGVLGSDNRLLYEVRRQYLELQMENIFRQVRSLHLHKDPLRLGEWSHRVNTEGRSYVIETS